MKVNILSDEEMTNIGFITLKSKNQWFFFKTLIDTIEFWLRINKDDPNDFTIDIFDDDFGQPYDYQHMLSKNPNFKYALKVKDEVDKTMQYLMDNNIITDYKIGDYI